jgi:type VI secretion system protein ImpA
MTTVNIEALLEPTRADAPCGDDLEYDAAFMELERTVNAPTQSRVVGPDEPPEGPNWRAVRDQSLALFARTKDLRVAVMLAKALLHTDGLTGFAEATRLLRELLRRHWDHVHPQLSAEEEFNPMMRNNVLRELNDRDGVLSPVRSSPIVSMPGFGKFSFRDIAIAQGELKPAAGTAPPDMDQIEQALMSCDLQKLQATTSSVGQILDNLTNMESVVTEKVGELQTIQFDELKAIIRPMHKLLTARIAQRPQTNGHNAAEGGGDSGVHGVHAANDSEMPENTVATQALRTKVSVPGSLETRDDVIRVLEQVCSYYAKNEPGSPVPMLLRRAQRLVPMSFMDLVRDLAPSGVDDVEKIRGADGS